MERYKVVVVYSLLFSFMPSFNTLKTITPGQSLKNNETLISANGSFEAGFFNIGTSDNQYLGIWYKNISPKTYVWVANRDSPLRNSSGVFEVTDKGNLKGNLVIFYDKGVAIWSSNASATAEKPTVVLLDTGNLVVTDGNNPDNLLWQSFNYPSDSMLPGMKLRSNVVTGQYTTVTSWRDVEDPAPGEFSLHIDPHGLPQVVIRKGLTSLYRVGSWNGYLFTGVPWLTMPKFFNYSFTLTEKEAVYVYELLNHSVVTRHVLNPSGLLQRFIWSDRNKIWELFDVGPMDRCDNYAMCGANSYCNINNSPICQCFKGFIQKSMENLSDGCSRRKKLGCNNGDGFVKYEGIKLPDTSSSWFDKNMTIEECEKLCLKNCSCTAYANLDERGGGSGCLIWFGDVIDVRKQIFDGQDLYIRVAASELDHNRNDSQFSTRNNGHIGKKKLVAIVVACAAPLMCMAILGLVLCMRRKKQEEPVKKRLLKVLTYKHEKEDIDLPTFDLSTIANATNYLSDSNKLGEGGFGAVYKGVLENGQEIAVKRLSKDSGQGPEEFKNEVVSIANLQHRNLVKLLGCCFQDDEKILIYEYMPNRSLDYFIFDQTRRNLLNWIRRFQIINGIARGLLYLHHDCRLRIIHRDLKASNILLDHSMNSKISNFGLARTFGRDRAEAKTKRVMGTYGYMPSEYAVHGLFSMKTDVFSFGVIVLEIVSGRKNRKFCDPHHHLNLLGHAWRLWIEERPLELTDESIRDSVTAFEVLRSINIGLLCVQDRPEDRPDMSSVVLMLNGDQKQLHTPRQPAFYPRQEGSSSGICEFCSKSGNSITLLEGR